MIESRAGIVAVAVVLVGAGVLVGTYADSRRRESRESDVATLAESPELAALAADPSNAGPAGAGGSDLRAPGVRNDMGVQQLERRLRALSDQVVAEKTERQRLQEQVAALTAQVAALHGETPGAAAVRAAAPQAPESPGATTQSPTPADASTQNAEPSPADVNPVERALLAAGVDPGTAADIKHRQDALALEQIYLRDQATRENWADSPRFTDEMAKLTSQQVSIRDEIGDDAYDRYLAAMGQNNRVQINNVLLDSPAAQAGMLSGDMVVRYGDARILAPDDLVQQTHAGTPGDEVQLQLLRNGQLVDVSVPRGPLGISITGVPAPALSPP